MWPFKKKRTVLLVMYYGDTKIVKAYQSQAGWIARWIGNDDQWSVLLPAGKVVGTTLVHRWLPHSGWSGDEFNGMPLLEQVTK